MQSLPVVYAELALLLLNKHLGQMFYLGVGENLT